MQFSLFDIDTELIIPLNTCVSNCLSHHLHQCFHLPATDPTSNWFKQISVLTYLQVSGRVNVQTG